MPAYPNGDYGPIHLPNPVAHHGDGYKDAIYEDFPQYYAGHSDYPNAGHHTRAPAYPEFMDLYGQPTHSAMYNQPAPYQADDFYPDHPCLHPMGAPMIPPVRIDERVVHPQQHDFAQVQGYATLPEPTYPKEEKATGGVSATLDYEVEVMTDFVSETTVAVIRAGHPVSSSFRKWVSQVLNATRLPSATILLSLSYLAMRVRQQTEAGAFVPSERSFYKLITIALILGSKFLDDNTFQNKSWAEVSNIPVKELNQEERDWLQDFQHRLHYDTKCVDGFDAAEQQWKSYQAQANAKANQRMSALQPIDTNLKRHRSMQALSSGSYYPYPHGKSTASNYSAEPSFFDRFDRMYGTHGYQPYEPYYGYRSTERSPLSSASHSGPQTPEYFNGSAYGWGSASQYSRSSQYGYPSMTPMYTPQSSAAASDYQLPSYRRQCAWTTHGAHCQCQSCRYQTPMQSRYSQAIMA